MRLAPPLPFRTPLAQALVLSVLAHLVLAAYLHYAPNVLQPIELQARADVDNGQAITAVLLPQAALPAPAQSAQKPAAPSTLPGTVREKSASLADKESPTKPVLEPTPTDTEVLPHEELARKKEPLPPPSLPPKDKPMQYSLPNQIRLGYEGAWGGTPIKGTLAFTLKGDDYTASLQLVASVLFKTFELKQSAQGVLSAQGLETLRAEDKAINGRTVSITAEPAQQRVIISSKEGFLPYTQGGKDLISVILQLGILVQAQPEWRSKGAAQDFTVYRPSGIKRWRYQSQGLANVQTSAGSVETVYIKRVPQNADPDFEYIHHLWLDAGRHGLPIRIQLEDAKSGRIIDLTMSQWDES